MKREPKAKTFEKYYVPENAKNVFKNVSKYPVTVVEAPSGFGKTTAVREFLKESTGKNVDKYWHTCFEEPVQKTWDAFCSMLSNFDTTSAGYLKRLGIPTEENLSDLADAMRRCSGEDETYIVIDNFQYIYETLPKLAIDAIATHGNHNLHIIFIMQHVDYANKRKFQNENIFHINSNALRLTLKDTDEYLKVKGIVLNEQELSQIHSITEGWVAALNLQRLNYEQSAKFEKSADMDALIKAAIWNHLSDDEKKFLIRVCSLENFTYEQATIMSGKKKLPTYAENLLDANPFIRYDKTGREYILHSLLRSYITQEYDKQPKSQKVSIQRLAGKAYASRGLNYTAMLHFLEAEDYRSLLELLISGHEFTSYISAGSTDALISIIDNCPKDILVQYPKKILVIAFELFMAGSSRAFRKTYELLNTIIENKDDYDISEEDGPIIEGEFARLQSFRFFNDIEKMSVKHREALNLLGGPATLFDWRDSWTFGQPSVLYLFWSKSGDLGHELELMDECLPYYYELTYGHGTGAETVMRAEALLMKGDDKAAETLCHKALYTAASKDQDSICYAAELILARIAMLRGDLDSYNTVLSNMNKKLLEGSEPGGQKIVDLSHGFLETAQGSLDIKEWLLDIKQIKKNLYPVASFYGVVMYLKTLIIKREYAAVSGLCEPLLSECKNYNFLLPQVYILIFAAIANLRLEDEKNALKYLDQALSIAIPDKIYMPFAEHGVMLDPLLKKQKNTAGILEILGLTKRLDEGVHIIKSEKSERPVLTQREREVAELAGNGLTNDQIASQLFVSVNTVKVLLKRVFAKLGIKSRAQLSDYL